ncbi:MAG: D-2-hydroxyacid dehydrogenase [Christensenellales bacterium]|jgi:phosphoglycerate dehydrogenase-like enzyme
MRNILIMNQEVARLERIAQIAPGWTVAVAPDYEAAQAHFADAEIVVTWSNRAAAACAKSDAVRWIQVLSAGVDALPLHELREKGIYLTNASGVHGLPISETMFAMMLAFARGLRTAIPDQRERRWAPDRHRLTEIHNKTLGILGVGAIGMEAARLGKAFGMRVLGLRRGGEGAPNVDHMYAPDEIDAMLPECDYVLNILPLTPETTHFMNAARFARMKPTACYISAGRGKTTDHDALIDALEHGIIACAGLDVTDPEPLPQDSALWGMENVIITPHFSGTTDEYYNRAFEIFIENLAAYVKTGAPVRNLVDYDLRY